MFLFQILVRRSGSIATSRAIWLGNVQGYLLSTSTTLGRRNYGGLAPSNLERGDDGLEETLCFLHLSG